MVCSSEIRFQILITSNKSENKNWKFIIELEIPDIIGSNLCTFSSNHSTNSVQLFSSKCTLKQLTNWFTHS